MRLARLSCLPLIVVVALILSLSAPRPCLAESAGEAAPALSAPAGEPAALAAAAEPTSPELATEPVPPAPAAALAMEPKAPPPPGTTDLRPDNLLGQLRYDFLYMVAAPVRMGPLGWGLTAGVAGATYLAQSHREHIDRWWQQHLRNSTTDTISDIVRPWGYQLTAPIVAGTFLAGGLLLGRSHEFETGVMLAESAVYTLGLTSLGQFVFDEDRPSQGGQARYLDGKIGHGISGHSSAAACLAGPLNRQYLQLADSDSGLMTAAKIGGKVAVYGLPVLVGLSRINGDSHYLWNVLAGWAIGYTVGELVPNAHEARKQGRSWWISPVMDDRAVGVAFQMTY